MLKKIVMTGVLSVVFLCGCTDIESMKTPDELRVSVLGKTPDEVIAVIGKPKDTQEDKDFTAWYYDNVSKDPVLDKSDSNTQVVFINGRVKEIRF